MTKFGIGQAVRRVEDQRFATGAGAICRRLCAAPAMLWRSGAFAACPCGDQARGRRRGEGGARRSCRAHRRRCFDRQDRRHSTVLHAGFLGRTQRISDHPSSPPRRSRPLRRRPCRLRRRRDRSAGARRRRACQRRLRAVARGRRPLSRARSRRRRRSGTDCPSGNIGVTIGFGDKARRCRLRCGQARGRVRLVNNRITANPIEPRCAIGIYDAADGPIYALHHVARSAQRARNARGRVFGVPQRKSG